MIIASGRGLTKVVATSPGAQRENRRLLEISQIFENGEVERIKGSILYNEMMMPKTLGDEIRRRRSQTRLDDGVIRMREEESSPSTKITMSARMYKSDHGVARRPRPIGLGTIVV